jgi:hypothetical protein
MPKSQIPKVSHEQPLSAEVLSRLASSDDVLAEYLVTLTPQQLKNYQVILRKDRTMPPAVQKTILKLFQQLEKEAQENQHLLEEAILPLATGIATALKLAEQIHILEDLERSLNSSPSV